MNLALSITTIKMITQNGVDLKNDFQSFRVTGVLNTPMPHRLFRSYLKKVFFLNFCVRPSFQVLDILEYACGLKLGPALTLSKLFFRTGLNFGCEGLLIFRCVTLLPELIFPAVQWFFHSRERFSTFEIFLNHVG
ncbi:MAG: hypothetical protein JRJ62_07480 [Deltaproteobacteria bacterium]|nr:hypothetical protein [Deltaproteobacteria bacterium]